MSQLFGFVFVLQLFTPMKKIKQQKGMTSENKNRGIEHGKES